MHWRGYGEVTRNIGEMESRWQISECQVLSRESQNLTSTERYTQKKLMHLHLRAPKRLLGWESHCLERRCPWRQWVDCYNVCLSNSWDSCPSQSSHIVRNLEFAPSARGHRATKYSLRSGCILKTGMLNKSLCDEWWALYLIVLLRIWQPDLRSEYSSLGKQTCPGERPIAIGIWKSVTK